MDNFVAEENIRHLIRLLQTEKDKTKRLLLLEPLALEEKNWPQ